MKDIPNLAPYMLVIGGIQSSTQAFLVVDKKIITEVNNFEDIPFCLMSAFFVFNIHYPVGCSNFYTFMEIYTLDYPVEKASITVKHLITALSH